MEIHMRLALASLTLSLAVSLSSFSAMAADATPSLPAKKQTQLGLYMSAKEAFEAKQAGADKVVFLDIRTPEEFEYVGHANIVDANIPYLKTDYSSWDEKKNLYAMVANSNFLVAFNDLMKQRKLDKKATVILMCRSGDRSALAADLLAKTGYTRVYSVYEGFEGDMAKGGDHDGKRAVNGWKNASLPWSYSMEKTKAYME
jgi:rhodanese-related sulfurtransferase